MLLMCLILVLFGFALTLLRYSYWRKTFCRHLPGKKPGFFNVIGDTSDILGYKDMHQGVMDLLKNRVESFRKEQLICLWLSYVPLIVVFKAEAVKNLLIDAKMNERSWMYDRMQLIIGTGLLTSQGEKWKSRRKLLMPCFHSNILKSFMTSFNEVAHRFVASLRKEITKDFTQIEDPIKLCALDIIGETIFGVKINALETEFTDYNNAFNRFTDIFMTSVSKPWLWPSFIFLNSKIGKEYLHQIQIMKDFTRNIIKEKKERHLRGEIDARLGKQNALMDLLIQKHLETHELSEEDIREEVDTFVAAGHETVAMSIMWALYLIGLHPEVQAKLHEEIDHLFGKDVERHVTQRDLLDLQYLDCVLKESGRLYSTVPIFVRQASEDTNICGYTIPKGTSCAIFTYFLHRDEEVFPDPEVFKPERFLPENSVNIPTCGYTPFAAGPRMCIGYKFAEMEMKIVVSSILRNFSIKSLDKRDKIQPVPKVTLQPSVPIRIRIRSRSD